jgi:hypothetical protein
MIVVRRCFPAECFTLAQRLEPLGGKVVVIKAEQDVQASMESHLGSYHNIDLLACQQKNYERQVGEIKDENLMVNN